MGTRGLGWVASKEDAYAAHRLVRGAGVRCGPKGCSVPKRSASMAPMEQSFRCAHCDKDSAFKTQADVMVMDGVDYMPIRLENEKRTYVCEHCQGKNVITMLGTEWLMMERARRAADH